MSSLGSDANFTMKLDLYNIAIEKLIVFISNNCREYGAILENIWKQYNNIVKTMIVELNKRVKEREHRLNRLSVDLLCRFEEKMKEYEDKTNEFKNYCTKYKKENEILKENLKQCDDEKTTILENCNQIKESNEKLIEEIKELQYVNKDLKLLFMKSDECTYIICR